MKGENKWIATRSRLGDAEDVDEDEEIRSFRGAIMNLIGNLDPDCRTTAMFNDPSLHLSFASLSQHTCAVYAGSQDMILMLLALITRAGGE